MTEYVPAKGSILSEDQAKRFGEHMESMVEELDGITPYDVLDDARTPKSPLHEFFDWDDSSAAEKYRIRQARYLLRTVHVKIKTNGDEVETRAFHVVVKMAEPQDNGSPGDSDKRIYTTAVNVFSEEDYRRQVVEQALKQLNSWRKNYEQYSELGHIIAALDEVLEKVA